MGAGFYHRAGDCDHGPPMRAHEIVARLEAFQRRGPGTDAERRAANWLAGELEHPAREVRVEAFWARPNWAIAHAWHVALAIGGSLVSVTDAYVGIALLLVALLSIAADVAFGVSIGRRLTAERASQNVVARPRPAARTPSSPRPAVRLVVTANYDAGRAGLVYRDGLRGIGARVRAALPAAGPGWLGWLCIGFVWLLVIAILRAGGNQSTLLAIAQFVPTALLVLVVAALLELGTAGYGPAANDNGSGAAAAVALVRALDAAPPRYMDVELVLAGEGEGGGLGLRTHLRRPAPAQPDPRRARGHRLGRWRGRRPGRRELDRTNAAVLAFAPCGAGSLRWWTSDGSFLPLRYSRRLRQLCAQVSEHGDAGPHRGRGTTPAFNARAAGIPAIALGCLDARGVVPRSHRPDDTAALIDAAALDATVEFALILVDALDSFLAETAPAEPPRAQASARAVPSSADP
jgi:hypothetical protein